MWTKSFWKDAFERAVKTFAQAILTIMTLAGINILVNPLSALEELRELGFIVILIGGLLGFAYSILTSIVSNFIGDKGTASLVKK